MYTTSVMMLQEHMMSFLLWREEDRKLAKYASDIKSIGLKLNRKVCGESSPTYKCLCFAIHKCSSQEPETTYGCQKTQSQDSEPFSGTSAYVDLTLLEVPETH